MGAEDPVVIGSSDLSLRLPRESLAHVLEYCDVTGLGRACVLARHWREAAACPTLWKDLCIKRYPSFFLPSRAGKGTGNGDEGKEVEEDDYVHGYLPVSHTRVADPYRALLQLRGYVLARKLVRWDQEDREAWAHGVVWVDLHAMSRHVVKEGYHYYREAFSPAECLGSLVVQGVSRTQREGMLRYHPASRNTLLLPLPQRQGMKLQGFVSLDEIRTYLETLAISCSAVMMQQPPAPLYSANDDGGRRWGGGGVGGELLPLANTFSKRRVVKRVWLRGIGPGMFPEIRKQGLEMVLEVVEQQPFVAQFLAWPHPLTGVLQCYYGVERIRGSRSGGGENKKGFGLRFLGMRFFKEG